MAGRDSRLAAGWGSDPDDSAGGDRGGAGNALSLHRLNRLEYRNSVRDLLGVELPSTAAFPTDLTEQGFDNDAEALSLSPALFGLYSQAAVRTAAAALDSQPAFAQTLPAQQFPTILGKFSSWGASISQPVAADFTLQADEKVVVTIGCASNPTGGAPVPTVTLKVDGNAVGSWMATTAPPTLGSHSVTVDLKAGKHSLEIDPGPVVNMPVQNVGNVVLIGATTLHSTRTAPGPGRPRVYVCDPAAPGTAEACLKTIVSTFAERAWRRPLSEAESAGVWALYASLRGPSGSDDDALRATVAALLQSPRFLYRGAEPDPAGDSEAAAGSASDHTLASRLSYFLWSSMPDETLFEAAKQGTLRTEAGLRAQVGRMLADPKSQGLLDGFAAQWLGVRMLETAAPDPKTFPDFDEPLRAAMMEESKRFFGDFLTNGQSCRNMLVPDFGYLNDRLARFYGLAAPGTAAMTRVKLAPTARRGLVTQGTFLAATGPGTRTSPVKRGRFLLTSFLCRDVPPPPGNVGMLPSSPDAAPKTARATLAAHVADPTCAVCHRLLDPLGLGLEQYDGIGALRQQELGAAVDSSGKLPDGTPFVGGLALADALRQSDAFSKCLSQKLFQYALGRQITAADQPQLDRLAAALGDNDHLDEMIQQVVLSPAFRMQAAP